MGGRGHWRSERGTGRQYRKRVSCDRSAGVKAIGFSHCIWRIDRDCGTCGCAVRGVRVAPDRMGCDTIKNHYTSYSTPRSEHSRSGSDRPPISPPAHIIVCMVHGGTVLESISILECARTVQYYRPIANVQYFAREGGLGSLHEKRALARLWHPSKVERLSPTRTPAWRPDLPKRTPDWRPDQVTS